MSLSVMKMKRYIVVVILNVVVLAAIAQPPARMREAAAEKTAATSPTTSPVNASQRAELDFPTAAPMPEDVAWRRDIYRSLDVEKDKNAVLYYPEEPQGDRMNLFTYLFKLMMRKQIKAYNYTIDGKEDFSTSNEVVPKAFLERNHIRFEERAGKFRIDRKSVV